MPTLPLALGRGVSVRPSPRAAVGLLLRVLGLFLLAATLPHGVGSVGACDEESGCTFAFFFGKIRQFKFLEMKICFAVIIHQSSFQGHGSAFIRGGTLTTALVRRERRGNRNDLVQESRADTTPCAWCAVQTSNRHFSKFQKL